jgi:[ribosomal protein S5]-alanine N-acetyltransferase
MRNHEIKTKRTILRKYKDSDKEKFVYLFTDREINHFMGGQHCKTREDAEELFRKGFDIYDGLFPDRHFELWAIEHSGELIGHFELKQTGHTSGNELEIVYMLDKEYWGQGLMPEILNEINKYSSGFNKQLIATINPENSRTVKALKKTGIEKEEWSEDEDGKVYKVWLKKYYPEI